MTVINEQIGWSTESKLLRYILKQLDKMGSLMRTAITITLKTINGESLIGEGNIEISGGEIVSTTYDDLVAAIGTWSGRYSFEFQTKQRMIDSDGNEIMALEDAPAPGNITITPDAVGSNPVTLDYKLAYISISNNVRSLFSSGTFQTGDSTTEIIVDCDSLPLWADNLIIFVGIGDELTDSGYSDTLPFDYYTIPAAPINYAQAEAIPIQQVEGNTPIIVTGTEETLVVTATSVNTLAKQTWSAEHPNDLIEYDWNPANWEHIPSFYDGANIVTGWKGVITWRYNADTGSSGNFDIRNCTYRLWSIEQPAWDFETEYNEGDFIRNSSNVIFVALDTSTDVEPGVDEGWETYWQPLIDLFTLGSDYFSFSPINFVIGEYILPIQDISDYSDIQYEVALLPPSIQHSNHQDRDITNLPYISSYAGHDNHFGTNCRYIVTPAYAAYNDFKSGVQNPVFTTLLDGVGSVEHWKTNTGVRQTYVDDSDNSIVITENSINVDIPG